MRFYLPALFALLLCLASPQATPASTPQIAIKTGIATITFNTMDAGSVTITYAKSMPDPVYNSVTSLAYINDYAPSNGLNFSADCSSGSNQVQLQCAVIAESSSADNILYMTYIVSDQQDFIVGSFSVQLSLTGTTLNTPISTAVSLPSSSPFKLSRNVINFVPLISGVTSLDGNFGLSFGLDESFDTNNGTLQFSVAITQFNQRTVNLSFGYILFLADRYVLNILPQKRYEPGNPSQNNNIIYAIQQINFLATPTRASSASVSPSSDSNSSLIYRSNSNSSQTTPIELSTSRSLQVASLLSTANSTFQAAVYQFQRLVSDGNFSLGQVKVRTVSQATIKSNTLPTNQSNILQLIAASSQAIPMAAAASTSRSPTIDSQSNNEFQQLFATNGFTIIVNTTISDPVLYLQLDPYVNVSPEAPAARSQAIIISKQPNPPPIFIVEPINTQLPQAISCPGGFITTVLTKIGIVQQTYRYVCICCPWGKYFDWGKKLCKDFPTLNIFLNVVDAV